MALLYISPIAGGCCLPHLICYLKLIINSCMHYFGGKNILLCGVYIDLETNQAPHAFEIMFKDIQLNFLVLPIHIAILQSYLFKKFSPEMCRSEGVVNNYQWGEGETTYLQVIYILHLPIWQKKSPRLCKDKIFSWPPHLHVETFSDTLPHLISTPVK